MNKKHFLLTPAEAIQRDMEAEGAPLPSHGWPTKIETADSSIWY